MSDTYNSDQNQAIAINLSTSRRLSKQGYQVRILCRGRKPAKHPTKNRPYWLLYGVDTWEFICGNSTAYQVINNFEENQDFRNVIHAYLYDLKAAAKKLIDGWRQYGLIKEWEMGERIDTTEWNALANDRYSEWVEAEEEAA